MGKEIIAIASSDWHLNNWKQHSDVIDRTMVTDMFLTHLLEISDLEEIPILFPGDMFHTPASLTNSLLGHYVEFFIKAAITYPNARILGITGNHDTSEGASYLKTFSLITPSLIQSIDYKSTDIKKGCSVFGIPYTKHNKDFDKAVEKFSKMKQDYRKILMVHTNLYGAKDPSGYEVDEVPNIPRNMGEFFKDFNLVCAGHIHKHDMLWRDKIIMVGAPYHQRTSDCGTPMGYLEIYDDLSVEFVHYKAPEFKYYQGDEPPDNEHYWIKIPEKKEFKSQAQDEGEFDSTSDKATLAKEYCRVNNIDNDRRKNLLIKTLNETEE